ncbi:geranylgeranyl reductase family protein [Actinomadura rubrisoli]|uniref:Geranylgeranyl reductase family protein n=1 Tax=Actinomadura rubrisoli TaxID=2530368 RepID=A0A4R5BAW4_9ACTN|nr:geranylgeranyl reductase family protein [Actinomadura rubrisoli]TDD82635.1 geranylgeranyl reductase family protein [Actinomadura rubrisoli]
MTSTESDVLVVGAGPAGSTVASYLARAGLDVRVLEKSAFPREKVCGDGLTPRAVHELMALGVDIDAPGWFRSRGLRLVGGGRTLEMPWSELTNLPPFGLVRPRRDFDETLARHAVRSGAALVENTKVTAPLTDDRTGRVIGVATDGGTHTARLVVAADGASSRLAVALGMRPRAGRPIGVAARRYFRGPRHDDDHLETWLDLGPAAYGWMFGVGDGTCNVGVALLSKAHADYRRLLRRWLETLPAGWGFTEENATGPLRGAALPMGFSRQPHYRPGLVLVGDSGGMVNPMNGEGIAYAMEAARIAAGTIVQALGPSSDAARAERLLASYPRALKAAHGGHFTLGRWFVSAIENPRIMRMATRQGMSRPALMRFTIKLLGNLTDPRGATATDRLAHALARMTPSS